MWLGYTPWRLANLTIGNTLHRGRDRSRHASEAEMTRGNLLYCQFSLTSYILSQVWPGGFPAGLANAFAQIT